MYVGEPISYEEMTAALERAMGESFERRVRTVGEAQRAVAADPTDFAARFVSALVEGKGTLWPVSHTYLAQRTSSSRSDLSRSELA